MENTKPTEISVQSAVADSASTSVLGTSPKLKTYTPSERNWYLIGLAGQNVTYNVIGAALSYYLQFTLLIPAMAVSIIMALARVWDAFNDPMMGTIVDRTRSKWGKCRPYLMVIPIPIFIITVLCFVNFGFYGQGIVSNGLIVFWAALTYILWGMTYTVGDIPLWGVTSLMTESEKDKTKLLSLARIAAGIGGGITLLAIQPLALALGDIFTNSVTNGNAALGEQYGFIVSAVIFGFIGCITFIPLGFKVKERINTNKEKYSLADNFKIALKNKPFRQIIFSGILSSMKMLISLAAMPLVTYYFSSKNPILALVYLAMLGGGMFLGQFICQAFTPALIARFSTKNLYNWANIIGAVPFALIFVCYLAAPSSLTDPFWLIICFILFTVAGGTNGITSVLQSTMIANAVDYEEYKNYRRPDAVFFSGQSFVTKLQSGIATIMSGIAYTIVGFSDSRVAELNSYINAGGTPSQVGEYASFMMILFLIVSILPAISSLLAIIPTWKYALDDDEHHRIIGILKKRREMNLEQRPENYDETACHDEITGEVITKEELEKQIQISRENNKLVLAEEKKLKLEQKAAAKAAKGKGKEEKFFFLENDDKDKKKKNKKEK